MLVVVTFVDGTTKSWETRGHGAIDQFIAALIENFGDGVEWVEIDIKIKARR